VFVDTSGWGNLFDPTEPFHRPAAAVVARATTPGRLVTTNLVLAELTGLLTSPLRLPKPTQIRLLADVRADPLVEIIHVDPALEAAGWHLWASRPDKAWSLADCVSFEVMRRRRLTDALTSDHHFEQAGFVRLLK
jgi:predicted nucleic acid-binding protein